MNMEHRYSVQLTWRGNRGTGTSGYRDYGREHTVSAAGKHAIEGSADRTFHGDADRWNPEELLIAALSQCHMLSYLHVASSRGIAVTAYEDDASGTMELAADGSGQFTQVTLKPRVTIADASQAESATGLHAEASTKCFIAASVNFPVAHEPEVVIA